MSTENKLMSGDAALKLSRGTREFVYKIAKADNSEGGGVTYFVRQRVSPTQWLYLGIWRPQHGWLELTAKSALPADAPGVRAFRWLAGQIWSGDYSPLEDGGFNLRVHAPHYVVPVETPTPELVAAPASVARPVDACTQARVDRLLRELRAKACSNPLGALRSLPGPRTRTSRLAKAFSRPHVRQPRIRLPDHRQPPSGRCKRWSPSYS